MKSSLRCLSSLVTGAAFVAFALLVPNCAPSGGDPNQANGGSSSSGNGGSPGSGGTTTSTTTTSNNGTGGSSSPGGTTSTGGTTSKSGTGGSSSSGGTTSKGGTTSTGAGGTSSSGGTSSGGGNTGSGGTTTTTTTPTGSGGTTSTTTSTSVGPTGTTVVFGAGKGQGAMTGYGYVALGASDTITSPTCGAAKTPITKAAPCAADPQWSSTSALCVSGTVPVLAATNPDYTGNWGLSVGLNSTDPAGNGLGQSFTSITITLTGTPSTGLRATVHKKGDLVDTTYCSPLTSGTAIPFTSFVTDCYNTVPAGTKLTAADVTNIDQVNVQVSSNQTAAITVTDLCITGITFAK